MDEKDLEKMYEEQKKPLEEPVEKAKIVQLVTHKKSRERTEESILTQIDYNKPVSTVFCVQNFEQGVMTGACFFNTQAKAQAVADMGNAKYAEMKVKFEMKVVSYPIF